MIGIGIGLWPMGTGGSSPLFDIFIDSVAGSDSNSGLTQSLPKQTIAAGQALISSSLKRVGLKRGSHWREQLTITQAGASVGSYATGALPILDGSDAISVGSITKTAGHTNVYQYTVTPAEAGVSTSWLNVFETGAAPAANAGTILKNVASEALVDSTAGSYFVSGMTQGAGIPSGASTVFFSSTDGTSPLTNGYTYESASRYSGLWMTVPNGVVSNIEGRKQAGNDGSIVLSGDGNSYQVSGVIARNGTKHNMLVPSGSTVANSVIINGYYGPVGGNALLVYFDSTHQTLSIFSTGNIFQQDQSPDGAGGTAIISHTGDGINMGAFVSNGDWFIVKNGAILSGLQLNNVPSVTLENGFASNIQTMILAGTNVTASNFQWVSGTSQSAFWSAQAASLTFNCTNCLMATTNGNAANNGVIYSYSHASPTINISGGALYLGGSGGANAVISDGGSGITGVSLTVNDFIFDGTVTSGYAYYFFGSGLVFSGGESGNANSYKTGIISNWMINNSDKTTLAAWQSAVSPQDSAAITTASGAYAATLPTIPTIS